MVAFYPEQLCLPAIASGAPLLDVVHCMDALVLLKGLPTNSIDCVLTDFPYGEVEQVSAGLRLLDRGDADRVTFDIEAVVREIARVCRESIYIFCGTEQVSIIRKILNEKMLTRHCIWEKTNPSPMNGQWCWLSSIENCIYGRKPSSTFNEFCKSSVWRFPSGSSKLHPTEKPLDLITYLIRTSTLPGDKVLDPFIGSGTTALAARNLNRRYIGGDISREYVELARRRLAQPFTLSMFDRIDPAPKPKQIELFAAAQP